MKALKEYLEWPSEEPFFVPDEVYDHYRQLAEGKKAAEDQWKQMFEEYCQAYPEMKALWDA